jgi:putative addiction module killer protein
MSLEDDNNSMQAKPRQIKNFQLPNGKEPFKEWLFTLKDIYGKGRIIDRLERIELGNLGKTRSAGEVHELKIDVGPGYRVYFGFDGPVLVILLCGGDKGTQKKDILTAEKYWADYKVQKDKKYE